MLRPSYPSERPCIIGCLPATDPIAARVIFVPDPVLEYLLLELENTMDRMSSDDRPPRCAGVSKSGG